jgi:hypothetical protein
MSKPLLRCGVPVKRRISMCSWASGSTVIFGAAGVAVFGTASPLRRWKWRSVLCALGALLLGDGR